MGDVSSGVNSNPCDALACRRSDQTLSRELRAKRREQLRKMTQLPSCKITKRTKPQAGEHGQFFRNKACSNCAPLEAKCGRLTGMYDGCVRRGKTDTCANTLSLESLNLLPAAQRPTRVLSEAFCWNATNRPTKTASV
ncbi:hypothetical protein VTO58DRAFT_107436 [Aureobasidium pullulans]|nr:hypothetical protein JADG_010215 [Aureobasidium pullulans]KAG2170477.1 hypothetical protein JADG_010216 [Aureobasidium pullulans]